jgi:hypothetical protein
METSIMHAQAVPIAVISAWLGHADAAFIVRTYVHAQNDALKGAAATLAGGCDTLVTANHASNAFAERVEGVCAGRGMDALSPLSGLNSPDGPAPEDEIPS